MTNFECRNVYFDQWWFTTWNWNGSGDLQTVGDELVLTWSMPGERNDLTVGLFFLEYSENLNACDEVAVPAPAGVCFTFDAVEPGQSTLSFAPTQVVGWWEDTSFTEILEGPDTGLLMGQQYEFARKVTLDDKDLEANPDADPYTFAWTFTFTFGDSPPTDPTTLTMTISPCGESGGRDLGLDIELQDYLDRAVSDLPDTL